MKSLRKLFVSFMANLRIRITVPCFPFYLCVKVGNEFVPQIFIRCYIVHAVFKKKQEISLKKINSDQYEKTLRNGTCAYYMIFYLTY